MRSRVWVLLGVLALTGCGGGGSERITRGNPQRGVLFQLQPGTDVDALLRDYGLVLEDSLPGDNLYRFRSLSGEEEHTLSERLRRDPRCADAEADEGVRTPEGGSVSGDPIHVPFDFVTPADSRYVTLSASFSSTTVNPTSSTQIGLSATRAAHRASSVIVAVLDTGVQTEHPSLKAHLLPGYNAITPTASVEEVRDGTQNTAYGHGTMVAGVIAQVAPDAQILPIRVLNADGSGSVFHVVRGLRWAVAHGAQVVNLSLGTTTPSRQLEAAIKDAQRAGVLVVASAGNAGKDQRDYPAAFNEVLSVAALNGDDTKASFSNYGTHIRLSAPGTGILSTYVGNGYATWSGTSFAAPFVAGAAALVKAAKPALEAPKVKDALLENTRSIQSANPLYTGKLGSGILNVGSALGAS